MDLRTIAVILVFLMSWWKLLYTASGNVMFPVQHKFNGKDWSFHDLVQHDSHRHGRMLDTVDLPIGGDGNPTTSGLYFTKLKIGTPGSDFHVQVDTGSDILWINCDSCTNCPTKTTLGIDLNLYDPKASSTSKAIACEDDACAMVYSGVLEGCKPDIACLFEITYGDQSTTAGYFVEDVFHYNKTASNKHISSGSGSIVFGCAKNQSGQNSGGAEPTDGIMGFGQANSSVISQLAAAKKVKNMFCHCLDGIEGGGIFAIGELVEPNISMTSYVPNQPHYNVLMKSVEIGDDVIDLTSDGTAAIIDTGTTLAYMPDNVYKPFMSAIEKMQPGLQIEIQEDQYKCFEYSDDIDAGFPDVVMHFTKSLTFSVQPSDYLIRSRGKWCISWMNNGMQSKDGTDLFLIGDMVLSNKLVVYDLDKQAIGWTVYNCSSSIKLKDGVNGPVQPVEAQNLVSGSTSLSGLPLTFWVLIISMIIQSIHYH